MIRRKSIPWYSLALVVILTMPATAQEGKTLAMTSDQVHHLAWSPDGKWIVGGAMDGTVRIWNAETGMKERDLQEPRRAARAVAFSPKGELVAAGGDDMQVGVWDTKTWTLVSKLAGHTGSVLNDVVFSPDGITLAVSSLEITEQGRKTNAEIKLWDAVKGTAKRTIRVPGEHVGGVKFSHDSKTLYIAAGSVLVVDVETGETKRTLKLDHGRARQLALAPDGKILYAGGGYTRQLDRGTQQISEVYVWDLENGTLLRTMRDLRIRLRSLALSVDGKFLATGTLGTMHSEKGSQWAGSELRVWEATTGKLVFSFEGKSGEMWAVAFAPDGKSLVCADSSHIYLLDTQTGKERSLLHTVSFRRLP